MGKTSPFCNTAKPNSAINTRLLALQFMTKPTPTKSISTEASRRRYSQEQWRVHERLCNPVDLHGQEATQGSNSGNGGSERGVVVPNWRRARSWSLVYPMARGGGGGGRRRVGSVSDADADAKLLWAEAGEVRGGAMCSVFF